MKDAKQFYNVGLEEDYLLWAIHKAAGAKDRTRFNPSLLSGERELLGNMIAAAWAGGFTPCTELVQTESNGVSGQKEIVTLWRGLVAASPSAAGPDYLESKLCRLSALRLSCARIEGIHALVMSDKEVEDIAEAFDTAGQAIRGIAGAPGIRKSGLQPAYVIDDVIDAMQWRAANPGLLRGAATGYHKLDRLLDGFKGGDLVIIGARPSVGKTALATCLMEGLSTRKVGSVIFSLEMMAIQIRVRLMATMSGVNPMGEGLNRAELGRLQHAAATMKANNNIWIDDTDRMNIAEIQSKTRHLVKDHGIKVVFIDYLQLVRGVRPESKKDRRIEVGEVSGKLKGLAKELDITIVGLAQLTRMQQSYNSTTEKYKSPKPSLQGLKESGDLEQDADVVMLLHRDIDSTPNEAELILAKNRNGPTGKIDMLFDPDITTFKEKAP